MNSFLPALMGIYGNQPARVPTAAEVNGGSAYRQPMNEGGLLAAPRPQRKLMDVVGNGAPLPRLDGLSALDASINDSLNRNAALAPSRGHKGLFPGKDWKTWVGVLGDALSAYGGQQPTFAPAMSRLRQLEQEGNLAREKLHAENEARLRERMAPKVEQVGNTLGMFDPSTQTYSPIFTAPQPWELYARALGHEPGSEGYTQAIEEYRAGTWNDEGVAGRIAVQAPRLEQSNINNIRTTSTSRENNIRSTGQSNTNNLRSTATSRENNIRSNDTARRGQDLRARIRGRRVGGVPVGNDEPMARDAQGRPMVVRDGKWVVVQ